VRARADADDPLAILLLPGRLEGLAMEAHVRDLLSIPRVVALEPSRLRPGRSVRDATSLRQARRLRFPGRPRLLLLYHPAQYPLARALCACHESLELWYMPPGRTALETTDREMLTFDELARERATQVLTATDDGVGSAPLRERLRELDVINPHAFIPSPRRPRRW
jgi:hypothetical protein